MLNYTYKLQRHQDTKLMAQLATANQLQKKTTMEKDSKGGAGEE